MGTLSKSEHRLSGSPARCTFQPNKLKSLTSALTVSAIVAGLSLAVATETSAQNPRLELGRRLERFEHAWETASTTQRVAAVPPLKTAVRSFFTLQLSEAGRQLDQAWLAVRKDAEVNELTKAMIGSQLLASPLCAETGSNALKIQLTSYYPTDTNPPVNTIASVKLTQTTGEPLAETQLSISELEQGTSWQIEQIPEGDHLLSVAIQNANSVFTLPSVTISRITELNRRLQHLKDTAVALKTTTRSQTATAFDVTIASTLRDETRLIENVIEGLPQEADFPLLYRLKSCEAMLTIRSEPTDFANQWHGAKEVWLTLGKELRSVPTRIHLPQETDKPLPVLFVFHGAGGSENMFFETYGAGRVIDEAAKRNWIVISPRQGLFGMSLDISDMLDALDQFVPVDRKRIMLLGHSMGASQVIKQIRKNPALPFAAVSLGGGGRMPSSDAKRSEHVAWYIGAGEQDFGLGAAKQLKQSLEASEVRNRFKVYKNVEHLVVVQAAIDDVFQFLDESVGKLTKPESNTPPKAPEKVLNEDR
ncbi:MAG TPA: hypothetical protein DEF45_24170 [Rhodopirellula sp.]|nr:hypothetical protein [Rhodopirellula sp.]